jgi:hypothetical protein
VFSFVFDSEECADEGAVVGIAASAGELASLCGERESFGLDV